MISVGIINPSWTISRHNTDQRCVSDLLDMTEHTENLKFHFASSKREQLAANANLLSERIFHKKLFSSIAVAPKHIADAYYRYGGDIHGLTLSPTVTRPTVSTLGFPTLMQDQKKGLAYLQQHASELAVHAKRSALVHFHTDCMRQAFLAHAPAWERRCVTVPFYLPHLHIASEASIRSKYQAGLTNILFVGNGPHKGLNDLCVALDSIADFLKSQAIAVTIVSKTKPSCLRFENVRHIPKLSRGDVQKLMQQSHIYAMVPYRESFGLVYVEAMAAGCALLSDNDIPRREIQDEGRCGMLVEPGRPDLIAASLQQLIENPKKTLEMALHGWQRAKTRYEPTLVAQQYASAFAQVV